MNCEFNEMRCSAFTRFELVVVLAVVSFASVLTLLSFKAPFNFKTRTNGTFHLQYIGQAFRNYDDTDGWRLLQQRFRSSAEGASVFQVFSNALNQRTFGVSPNFMV